MTSVEELLESMTSMGSSQMVSLSPHATRTPATANAVASFAVKNADVCRNFLLPMETS